MKWAADITTPKLMHFEIEPEVYTDARGQFPETHYKVYVYENGKGTHDYLQDTFEQAKGFAFRKFGVPLDAWRQVSE